MKQNGWWKQTLTHTQFFRLPTAYPPNALFLWPVLLSVVFFLHSFCTAGLSGSRKSAGCGLWWKVWLSWGSLSNCCCGSQMKDVIQSLTGPFNNALTLPLSLSLIHTQIPTKEKKHRIRALLFRQARENAINWKESTMNCLAGKEMTFTSVFILHLSRILRRHYYATW